VDVLKNGERPKTKKPPSVSELVAAARAGDRAAMEALIRRELPWVRGLIAGYIRSPEEVDDLCQEVFISVWRRLGRLRRAGRFRPWLYRITINKVRSYLRHRRRSLEAPLPEEDDVPAEDHSAERLQEQELLEQALAALPAEYRDPLVIHYFQGKSTAETAAILGLRPVTARIRLMRARRQLARVLRKMGVL